MSHQFLYSGEYSCRASNFYGSIRSTIDVVVHIAALITSHPKEVSIEAGGRAMLPCVAVGRPKPLITWTNQNTDLVSSDRPISDRFELNGDNLVIHDVTLADDGYYSCIAENEAGSDSIKIALNVLMRPVIFKKWEVLPVEGETITLECEARGVPEPHVSWYMDDEPVEPSNHFDIDEQKLIIYEIENEDSGEWKCVAENEVGSAEESENIQVQSIPEILQEKQKEEITEFETLSLDCKISAETSTKTPIVIKWFKDGFPIDDVISSSRIWYSSDR